MPKKRTFYSEEERKAHHEKKQREADLQAAPKTARAQSQGHRRIPRIQHSVLQIFFTKHNADLPAAS